MKPRKALSEILRKRAQNRSHQNGSFSVHKILDFLQKDVEETYVYRAYRTRARSPLSFRRPKIRFWHSYRDFKRSIKRLRASIFSFFYFPHIVVRYLHDHLYHKSTTYKRYHDHPATETVHRAVLVGFVASFFVFNVLQYTVPNIFNLLTPSKTLASSQTAKWTTKGDFDSNASTTGVATNKVSVKSSGSIASDDSNLTLFDPAVNFDTISVVSNYGTSMAIKTDGTLWSWGYNVNGQLGLGDTTDRLVPTQVGTAANWKSVEVGDNYAMAIKADGTLWAWGSNSNGTLGLGLGDTTKRLVPTQVGTGANWKTVSCSRYFSLAIKTDGSLWSWGLNDSGQLGLGDTTYRSVPTQVGASTNWKLLSTGNIPSIATFYGDSTSLAIKTDGSLWSWGGNTFGQLGLNNTTSYSIPTQVGTSLNWTAVSTSGKSTSAIMADGSLWSWGGNNRGQLGLGDSVNRSTPVRVGTDYDWKEISVGTEYMLGVKQDGTVWSWGYNSDGQLGNGSSYTCTATINSCGTIYCSAYTSVANVYIPTKIVSIVSAKIVTASEFSLATNGTNGYYTGAASSMLVKNDGTLWSWGNNGYGQLGFGDKSNRLIATQVGTATTWRGVTVTYPSPGVISGLKINASSKPKWSTISWNTASLPSNASVKFRVRSSDTESGLGTATWTNYYTQTTAGSTSGSGNLAQDSPGGVVASKWLEAEITLATSDGQYTPTLTDFSINYDSLESPVNTATSVYKADGTTLLRNTTGNTGAGIGSLYTNENSINITNPSLTCTNCSGITTGRKLQVQYNPVGTAFTDETTNLISGTSTLNADSTTYTSTVTIPNLTNGTGYHLRMRTIDDAGRVSAWQSYGNNTDTSVADVTVDQTTVSAGTMVLSGNNTGSLVYINNLNDKRLAKVVLPLSDNMSTSLDVQFSEDGVNGWGIYNGASDGSGSVILDNSWGSGSYKTVTGITTNSTSVSIPEAWKFTSTSDGTKPLYARVRDMAGNVTTSTTSSNIILDTTNPVVPAASITAPVSGTSWMGGSSQNITWNTAGILDVTAGLTTAPIKLEYSTDNGSSWNNANITSATANSGSFTWNSLPSIDSTTVKLRLTVTDKAGNSATQLSDTFTIDSSAPTVSVTSPLNQYYKTASIEVPYTVADSISGVNYTNLYYTRQTSAPYTWIKYAGTVTNSTASPFVFDTSKLSDNTKYGNYGFKTVATDKAGNVSAIPSTSTAPDATTIIDYVAPTFVNLSFEEGQYTSSSLGTANLDFSVNDLGGSSLSQYELSYDYEVVSDKNTATWGTAQTLNGNSYSVSAIPWTLSSGQGIKYATVRVTDLAGNQVIQSASIIYDTVIPGDPTTISAQKSSTDPIIVNQSTWYSFTSPKFSWSANDGSDGSGINGYWVYLGNSASGNPMDTNLSSLNRFYLTAEKDGSGILARDLSSYGYPEGKLFLKVKAVDNVGLLSNGISSFTYYYDKTAPTYVSGLTASNNIVDQIHVTWNPYSVTSNESTIEKYQIERIKAQYTINGVTYTPLVNDSSWYNADINSGYAVFDFYKSDPIFSAHGFYDDKSDPIQGQTALETGIRYVYRIRAKDTANTNLGPWQNTGEVYGLTRDTMPPSPGPTTVSVGICTTLATQNCSDAANVGHETKITWTGASDIGSGMKGYKIYRRVTGSGDYTVVGFLDVSAGGAPALVWYDNDTNNAATDPDFKPVASANVNDYTYYEYRVTAVDNSIDYNETSLVPTTYAENWAIATDRTPDVTNPPAPTTLSATALGLDDSDIEDDSVGHQWIKVRWLQDADANLYGGDGSGIVSIRLYRSDAPDGLYTDVTDDTNNPVECSLEDWSCTQKHLPDLTYFYYKAMVIDATGNMSLLSASPAEVRTARSSAPTLPQTVQVTHIAGDASLNSKVGHVLHVSFTGSYAKDCEIANNKYCLEAYEVYRSTTNYTSESDWLDGTKTTRLPDITVPAGTKEERGYARSFDDEGQTYANPNSKVGLSDSTKYYYRVRARDNTPADDIVPGPFYSALTEIDEVSPTGLNKGWDITPDATKPVLTHTDQATGVVTTGLEVKVKDTHPNSTDLRNIISWLVVDKPGRKKMANESCEDTFVKSGITYCNDFLSYDVYRQQLDDNNNVILTEKVSSITDIQTNYYMDVLPLALQNNKYNYYVVVSDNSAVNFKYPAPYNGIINRVANVSEKSYSDYSIIPGKSKPILVGTVALSDIQVASAVVTWKTDQEADSLVQYRPKGSTSAYISVGQIERSINHSVRLFGLSPNTEYEYNVVSRNYLGNDLVYDQAALPKLTTTGFSVTTGSVATTTTGATISWTTNLDADSAFIEYQMQKQPGDEAQGKTVGVNPDDLSSNPKNHKVVVSGLKSNRTYTYKIKSISKDGFVAETGFLTFSTKSFDTAAFTLAPSSANVDERNITATSAQIVWETAVPTTNWVRYGTTAGSYIYAAGDNGLSTTHAVKIDGLIPGTTYYYIIDVKDANDTPYTSKEYSFTAVLKPKISNFKVEEVKPYSFTITWDTNIDTETMINLGKTSAYGEKRGVSGYSKVHKLVIDGLDDNTEYHYQILAKDETGYEVAADDEIVRTPMDTQGPVMSAVKVDVLPMGENDTTSSIIVSWQTDKPATTLVEYDQGIIGGTYNNQSTEDTSLNNSHTVIIKNLAPASSYHYRLISKDKRGNVTTSQDYTFVTPSKEKSILQMILTSLEETFAWTAHLNQFFGNVGKRLTGKN